MSFLSLSGVGKRYGAVNALVGFDLDIEAGARTVVVGASGSGKTTLLRLIAGFEMPDRGRIVLDGQTLADGSAGMPVHLRGIAFVAQDGALFPHMTVADNIGFAIDRRDGGRVKRIAELMDLVELPDSTAERAPHQLSGGQQQRVAIARGLARQPRLMLLDEPFSALDAGLRESVRHAAARVLRAAGVTTILVTHDQTEALSFADQLAVLAEGRLAQAGPPRELYLRPRDPETATFLGDAIVLPAKISGGVADCAFGRVPVAAGSASGSGQIMIRPEQLKLGPIGATASGVTGRIVDVVFGGSTSMVLVTITGVDGSGDRTVTMRVPSSEALPAGTRTTVSVSGVAHVFPMGAAADPAAHAQP